MAITEALCGHSFSASSIGAVTKSLDAGPRAFSEPRLTMLIPISFSMSAKSVREGGIYAFRSTHSSTDQARKRVRPRELSHPQKKHYKSMVYAENLAPRAGLEPATERLTAACSTN
jgi:hypothetical protein